ncbi:MAG TPA: DUF1592 domain-containing protein [Verrucomicrobiae bacterium]|nr:DUF1592 domain-containing protein [Verrucomicrobiae bacterium]
MAACLGISAAARAADGARVFHKQIQPMLVQYCGDCHLDGMKKGNVSLDDFKTDRDALTNKDLWAMVLKNVRGNIMPPPKKEQPTAAERERLVQWIKFDVFGIDPRNIDPGRVTVRRLNRVEYRNTIRDLTGVDFDTDSEFPPDDTGYGFDDIGEVLNLSPMLLEKYLDAANRIVAQAVPAQSRVMPEKILPGRAFHATNAPGSEAWGNLSLSYYDPALVVNSFHAEHAGHYQVAVDLTANERYVEDQFDANKCRLIVRIDGKEVGRYEYGRESGQPFHYDYAQDWTAGDHQVALEIEPLTHEKQIRSLTLRLVSATIHGPADAQYWVEPPNYRRFFPKIVPADAAARHIYAREILGDFASKAFRRPADAETVERLTALAENRAQEPGATFEAGISHAFVAILASPRFLYRQEHAASTQATPFIDEYSLASRLSYFLWSTMPDAELMSLAAAGKLRAGLDNQVQRMLADPKAAALAKNFTGQWLQARDIDIVAVDPRTILSSQEKKDPHAEEMRAQFREFAAKDHLTAEEKEKFNKLREGFRKTFGRFNLQFDYDLRTAMRQEVELYFSHIVHEDRSVLDFLQSDYTFLNERLARHYGLTNLNVTGSQMRLVKLPADSPRGGVLTMGGVLAVTSNPTRTSPVKRGLFVLDNILGNPPPPAPPNIPALEDIEKGAHDHDLTLRETLAIHREKPVCASCHNHMDPLGLAMENFNALGMWREHDHGEPIDCTGTLLSGESFQSPRELKQILVANHHLEFYRTLTEKLLTYALGRGLEPQDTETVDQIVDQMEKANGRFSALLGGVIHSIPFQKTRQSPLLGGPETAMTKEKS